MPDGYGACYALIDHCIKIGISCTATPEHTVDVAQYSESVTSALLDLRALSEAAAERGRL